MLLLALALPTTSAPPAPSRRVHGRRLFQSLKEPSATKKPPPRTAPASPKAVVGAATEYAGEAPAFSSNETISLMRERGLLQVRLVQIDALLAAQRDARKRMLTAEYEREMAELDDEALVGTEVPRRMAAGMGQGGGGLRDNVAAAVAQYRQTAPSAGTGGMPHQDIEHQNIDIDVVMMHMDEDGDGVITQSEAYGNHGNHGSHGKRGTTAAGPGGVQWHLLGPALLGCACSVACYLSLRSICGGRLRRGAAGTHADSALHISGGRGPSSGPSNKRRKHVVGVLRGP